MKFTYRSDKGSPLSSCEIDTNFKIVEELMANASGKLLSYNSVAEAMAATITTDNVPFLMVAPTDGSAEGYWSYDSTEDAGCKWDKNFEVGDSAYQVWLNNGNTGTEQEYLDSLKGADGAITNLDQTPTEGNIGKAISSDGVYSINEIVKKNAEDISLLKTDLEVENDTHKGSFLNNSIKGRGALVNLTYDSDITITNVYIQTGDVTANTDVDGYLYVVDENRIITQALGRFEILGANPDTQYEIYSSDFTLPKGQRIGIFQGVELSLKYDDGLNPNGFDFAPNDTVEDKNVGELMVTDPIQTFTKELSVGWDYIVSSIVVLDKTQKLNTLGNAISGFEVEKATNPKEPVQKQTFDVLDDEFDTLKGDIISNNDDYQLEFLSNTSAGSTVVSNTIYEVEAKISKIYIQTGAITANTDVDGYLYVVDENDVITQSLGLFTITSASPNTQYEIYSSEVTLPIGHKIGIISGSDFRLKYNSAPLSSGFKISIIASNTPDKSVGEDIFEVTSTDYDLSISIGWEATVYGVDINKKTQKLTTDGNAISGFEVETATNPKEPVQLKQVVQNNYNRLNLCGIGDSMMKGHSLSADEVYAYLIAERLGMTFTNLGINGNYLSDNGGSGTPLVNRVEDIPTDTDILIVDIGTNDAQDTEVTIGLEDSTDITEFYGALNSFLEQVVNRIPKARIIFISPYLRVTRAQDYVDALKVGCAKYGIPILDNITNGLIKWDNTAQYELLTLQDTYHFNALGHLRNSYKIEAFMKSKI